MRCIASNSSSIGYIILTPRHLEMMLGGHSLVAAAAGNSGGEESQQSQASLFNSGSELANSMELFSQPYSCSSASQHSQAYPTAHTHQLNKHTGTPSIL